MSKAFSSKPFVAGLVLMVTAVASTPLFITTGETIRTFPSADNPSWDVMTPSVWDFRIPALVFVSGVVLMLAAPLARTRRRGGTGSGS